MEPSNNVGVLEPAGHFSLSPFNNDAYSAQFPPVTARSALPPIPVARARHWFHFLIAVGARFLLRSLVILPRVSRREGQLFHVVETVTNILLL